MLQKKREMEARLLWANKPDKLQQAKDEISEVRRAVLSEQCDRRCFELEGWVKQGLREPQRLQEGLLLVPLCVALHKGSWARRKLGHRV